MEKFFGGASLLENYPRWLVGILVVVILGLEIILPNEYIVGYGCLVRLKQLTPFC
jgi:hypothetical protein